MRKAIAILITVLGFSAANAQLTIKPGVRAGLNLSKFTNSDTNFKPDFFVGGSVAIKFVKFYTLQPEITYSRQGAKVVQYYYPTDVTFDPIISGRRTEQKFSLDYLSVGIINKFTFKGFQVLVGPSFDFKVADDFVSNYAESPVGFDLALVAGVGYQFSNGIGVDLRFKQGMMDIFGHNYETDYYDDNGDYYESNGNYDDVILNQLVQLGISYSFDLK